MAPLQRQAGVLAVLAASLALAAASFLWTSQRLQKADAFGLNGDATSPPIRQSEEDTCTDLALNYSALQREYDLLKSRMEKRVKPTPPPIGKPSNVLFQSVRTWATAASQRAWPEFECVGPEVDASLGPRHAATAALWKSLPGKGKCGCLHLVEPVRYSNKTCVAPLSSKPLCSNRSTSPLWVVFAGDSTFRYFYTTLEKVLKSTPLPSQPRQFDQGPRRSLDDETRYLGAVGLDEDMDTHFRSGSADFVFSYRVMWGTQTSRLLSILRRPHTHRVKPYFTDPAVSGSFGEMQLHSGALDEPLFVETRSGVPAELEACHGPDLVVSGFGFWDIISLFNKGDGTGNAEKDRCGLERNGTSYQLFPSRLVTMLNAACELYGPDRFLYRTLNRGDIDKGSSYPIDLLNQPASKVAREMGIHVLDFASIARLRGDVRIDTTHADIPIVAQGLCQVFRFLLDRLPASAGLKRRTVQALFNFVSDGIADSQCGKL